MSLNTKSVLIVSYGPVPTPQNQVVEGGGMRAWGLAKGLAKNGVSVTVAINESFPQEIYEHDGIMLVNWSLDESFIALLNSFDTVIASYCMGDNSVFIANNLKPSIQLVLDVYVPIYVEVSARDTDDMPNEYSNYHADVLRHNQVLKRGDYFICANEVQKVFYTGVLGGLGIINPLTYRQDRIMTVPFGLTNSTPTVGKDPYKKLGIDAKDKRILWFGGLYPWFDISNLLDAISSLVEQDSTYKLVIVGGKNPFNNNPDLLRQYEHAKKYAKSKSLIDKHIFFVDWVEYDTRADWYKHADFVISINQSGEENTFAWRTRVMDYIWGEIVPLTNGGDPLGNELINEGAAIPLPDLQPGTIAESIKKIYAEPRALRTAQNNLKKIKSKYDWVKITHSLSKVIYSGKLPYLQEQDFVEKNKIEIHNNFAILNSADVTESKFKKAIRNPRVVLSYAKNKGLRRSVKLGLDIAGSQLKKRTDSQGSFVLIGHPIDYSGAPVVLLQIIDELIEKYGSSRIRLIVPSIDIEIKKKLQQKGVKIEKAAIMSYGLTAAQLALKKNDFVLMNTVAVYDNYREVCLNMLAHSRIERLSWFIHEDEPQLEIVSPSLLKQKNIQNISKLVNSGGLRIFVPSLRIKKLYDELFSTNTVTTVPLRIPVPEKYMKKRVAKDYDKLAFYLSGSPRDGRKGQLIALSAFNTFLLKYNDRNPEKYRDFEVNFLTIGDDYISQQIKSIGSSTLGERLNIYPSLPLEEALEVCNKSNVVICCSLNETFAIYVAEGMLMGHIVLRNNSAGVDEQLVDGKNGFLITDNVNEFADKIETLLNKKMSNAELLAMSKSSQELMKEYSTNKYLPSIES